MFHMYSQFVMLCHFWCLTASKFLCSYVHGGDITLLLCILLHYKGSLLLRWLSTANCKNFQQTAKIISSLFNVCVMRFSVWYFRVSRMANFHGFMIFYSIMNLNPQIYFNVFHVSKFPCIYDTVCACICIYAMCLHISLYMCNMHGMHV